MSRFMFRVSLGVETLVEKPIWMVLTKGGKLTTVLDSHC